MLTQKNLIVSVQCPNCMKVYDTELLEDTEDRIPCPLCGVDFDLRTHIYKAKMTIVIEKTFKPMENFDNF